MLTIHGVAVTTRGAAATIRGVVAMNRDVAVMNRGVALMNVPQRPSLRLSRFLIPGITSYRYDAPCTHSFAHDCDQQNCRKR